MFSNRFEAKERATHDGMNTAVDRSVYQFLATTGRYAD